MSTTIIEEIYHNNEELLNYLREQEQFSLYSNVENSFPKMLLLSIASYFEDTIKQTLLNFSQEQAPPILCHFIRNKAIERQYHTFFSWNASNANQFFGLFGDEFKNAMHDKVEENEDLKRAIQAFMEIGRTRNALVHGNFASFPMEKTAKEIFDLYQQAHVFLTILPDLIHQHSHSS